MPTGILVGQMDWKQIQANYRRDFIEAKERGATQEKVSLFGVTQTTISRLVRGRTFGPLGPRTMTFVQAVRGLGVPLSVFFGEIERSNAEDEQLRLLPWARGSTTGQRITPPLIGPTPEHTVGRRLIRLHAKLELLSREREAVLKTIENIVDGVIDEFRGAKR